jgi:RNA polymerase sigma-70 factor (ECF subfamily)
LPITISPETPDEALAESVAQGSDKAFKILVERHSASVFTLALKITRDKEESRDIVQETFIKVHHNISEYSRDKASFKTWLLTIARNQSLNLFASMKRRGARFLSGFAPDSDDFSAGPEILASNNPGPEKELSQKQDMELLESAMDKLPEKQRTALILKAWEGLTYKEISEIMGISVSSVESLIFRARKKLMESF